jgi:hypothetical protein
MCSARAVSANTKPRDTFLAAAILELAQTRKLGLIGGDDHLSDSADRDLMLVIRAIQKASTLDAQPRLPGPGV